MVEKHTCKTCGGPTEGYICDQCGQEMMECNISHSCGTERCQPKCSGCNKAESECSC